MRIVAISDIHGRIERLEVAARDVQSADIVLLTGDITNFGRRADAERMLQPIEELNTPLLAVTGNCDYQEVEEYISELGINLHAAARNINGVAVVGLGGSLPGPAPTPNEYSEGQIASFLARAVEGLDPALPMILNSHQPPADTVADRLPDGSHVGSRAVREFIERHHPLVCFTGHIHEGVGVDQIGPTQVVNPGPLNTGRYAYAELEDGRLISAEIRGDRD